ncbi:flagellar basal body rod protein FlgC [Gudongella oleilytica]|jgi:flagellar basal-body rod protein FlgC|uniref:flagellar basal body rod protein FlgC n=1 Tax=Gudongella oleilytica TaxID=1582259 RepID=UPI002A35A41E|nr:flagellar basal body rod protein FlgC [Gudongella oleilytica]MDY0256552.1 flagellar basal body rod protein FlgC [Gudongella oleilytica]
MTVFKSMQINATGLNLERLKLDTISTNIANANTTRTENGEAYRRKVVVFRERLSAETDRQSGLASVRSEGVSVVGIAEDQSDFRLEYSPEHPDADENGYVRLPNVNMVDEMIDLIRTQRTYEANVTALNTSKSILKKALEISKD